jgi:hypothetical protein
MRLPNLGNAAQQAVNQAANQARKTATQVKSTTKAVAGKVGAKASQVERKAAQLAQKTDRFAEKTANKVAAKAEQTAQKAERFVEKTATRVAAKAEQTAQKAERFVEKTASKVAAKAEQAKAEFDTTRGTREAVAQTLGDGFEATRQGREYAYNLVTSDGAWGKSVPFDTGTQTPFHVGYGERLPTLAEAHTPLPEGAPEDLKLLGARGRVMGEASAQTLSAAIGVEGEVGARLTGRGSDPDGPIPTASLGDAFIGARTRNVAEAGVLGASIGSETFLGAEVYVAETAGAKEDGELSMQAQIQAGFRAAAHASVTALGIAGEERMEFGVRGRAAGQKEIPMLFGVGQRFAMRGDVFAGMTEGGFAKAGLTGVGAGGEWFAGARAEAEARLALTVAGTELVGMGVTGEGWVGIGAKAEGGLSYDKEHHDVRLKGGGGVAFGYGGAVGVEVTLGGDGLTNIAGGSTEK